MKKTIRQWARAAASRCPGRGPRRGQGAAFAALIALLFATPACGSVESAQFDAHARSDAAVATPADAAPPRFDAGVRPSADAAPSPPDLSALTSAAGHLSGATYNVDFQFGQAFDPGPVSGKSETLELATPINRR